MNQKVVFAALLAAVSLAAAGCSSGQKTSNAPAVELAKVVDETVLPVTEGAPIELLKLENPIDYGYSSSDTDMIFEKKDGVWLDAMDSGIPINQEKFQAMADNFLNLHAVSQVENPGSLDDYGLSNPAYSLYITDGKVGERMINIGSQDETGNYYATLDNVHVYTLLPATVGSMVFDYHSLVIRDGLDLQVTADSLLNASVTANKKTVRYRSKDADAMERIAEGINRLTPVEFASYKATSQELSWTELTEDSRITFQAKLKLGEETRSLVVYVGTYPDVYGEKRYVQLGGSDMIMIVENETVKNLLNIQE